MRNVAGGGAIESVIASPVIRYTEFEVDDSFAYILSDSDVSRIPVAGGDVEVLASWGAGESVVDIALSDGILGLASTSKLATLPGVGGTPVTRDSAYTYRLVATSEAIYYFRSVAAAIDCSLGSELMRVAPRENTVPVLVAREMGPCVREMTADDVGVYWISGDGLSLRKVGG